VTEVRLLHNGRVLMTHGKPIDGEWSSHRLSIADVTIEGRSSKKSLEREYYFATWASLGILGLFMITIWWLIGRFVKKHLVIPIMQLEQSMVNVFENPHLDIEVNPSQRIKELHSIGTAFNTMLERVQERDKKLQNAHDQLEQHAKETLALQKQRLDFILEGTNVGTWEWNVQTGDVTFNERWAEIVGYSLEELAPINIDTWIKLAHPDDLKMSGELLEQHFNGELDYYEYEARMRHKNGNWIWVLDRGKVATWTKDGKPLLMSGTHQDITERKEVEEQIRVSELAKSEFLSTASHELRTPLTIIKEFVSLVKDGIPGPINSDQAECLDSASQNCDRLGKLINDILDLQRIDHGSEELHRSQYDIQSLSCNCQRDFQPQFDKKELTLEVLYDDNLPPILVDQDKVMQVIVNLLGNAIKFTPSGGSVLIRALVDDNEPDYVVVEIEDSGPGLSEDNQKNIFDKFTQVNREHGPGTKGTGLGLAIAKNLVELHGGGICVESRPGQGCKFSFTVPVYTDRKAMCVLVEDRLQVAARSNTVVCTAIIRSEIPSNLDNVEQSLSKELRRQDDIVFVLEDEKAILVLAEVEQETLQILGKRLCEAIANVEGISMAIDIVNNSDSVEKQLARIESQLAPSTSVWSELADSRDVNMNKEGLEIEHLKQRKTHV